MRIEKFSIGILGTNCYLVINEDTKEVIIIDPSAFPKKLQAYIEEEKLVPRAVILTHGHFDHTMGVDQIREAYNISVYAYEDEIELLADPDMNLSKSYCKGFRLDHVLPLHDHEVLELAGLKIEVLHTPGHTKGGCCFYIEAEKVVFSGDTLFQMSVGRTDFVGSSMEDLEKSIRERLFVLPDDTLVCPGHMGETMIGYEKTHNPYV